MLYFCNLYVLNSYYKVISCNFHFGFYFQYYYDYYTECFRFHVIVISKLSVCFGYVMV